MTDVLRSAQPSEILRRMNGDEAVRILNQSICTLQTHMDALCVAMTQLVQKKSAIQRMMEPREDLFAEQECEI